MMRHTGLVSTALGLLFLGPTAASELLGQQTRERDPLTQAWFDTVQSIGTLEGLATQIESGRPGAVQNLLRNTEVPLGDREERTQRIDELQLEIDRMRSELDVLRLTVTQGRPAAAPDDADAPSATPAAPRTTKIEAATVGLTAEERRALLEGRHPEPVDDVAAALSAARQRVLDQAAGRRPLGGGATAPTAADRPLPADPAPILPPDPAPDVAPAATADPTASAALPVPGPGRAPTDPAAVAAMPTTLVMEPTGGASTALPRSPANEPSPTPSVPVPLPSADARPAATTVGTAPIAERLAAARADSDATVATDLQARVAGAYSADAVLQGRAAYFAGDYQRALATLAPIVDDARALYWTGRTYEKLERATDAMRCYEAVIAAPDAGDLVARAQLDLDFLRWKWEHSQGFDALRQGAQGAGSDAR